MTCQATDCERAATARGYCPNHYYQARRNGNLQVGLVTINGRRFHRAGTPVRILDQLETDGGWLTLETLAMLVGGDPKALRKTLIRLVDWEMVEVREVMMNHLDKRFEYRVKELVDA